MGRYTGDEQNNMKTCVIQSKKINGFVKHILFTYVEGVSDRGVDSILVCCKVFHLLCPTIIAAFKYCVRGLGPPKEHFR